MKKTKNESLNNDSLNINENNYIKACEKKLTIIEIITLAFQMPQFIFYLIKAFNDSQTYAPALFKITILIVILYASLHYLKKGTYEIAKILLVCSLLSIIYIGQMYQLTDKTTIPSIITSCYLVSALWNICSMAYIIFNKDMKKYFE